MRNLKSLPIHRKYKIHQLDGIWDNQTVKSNYFPLPTPLPPFKDGPNIMLVLDWPTTLDIGAG